MKKIVIVIGATGGIGSAICKYIYEYSEIPLLMIYRNKEKYRKIFPNMKKKEIYAGIYEDVYKYSLNILNEIKYDNITLIMGAFTILPIKRIENLKIEEVFENINTNIVLNVRIINDILNLCRRYGCNLNVVNFDSGAAYKPLEGWSLYSSAKAYLNMYLKSLVYENKDVKAVSFDPGVVDTDMQKDIRETSISQFGDVEKFQKYKINHQLNSPADVAKYVYDRYIADWCADTFTERFTYK